MATFHGVNINFALTGMASTAWGATALMQSADVSSNQDKLEVRNQIGNVVSTVHYNPTQTATFEWIVSDAVTPPVGTATRVSPSVGSLISTTGASDSGFNNAYWIVDSIDLKATNTDVLKVSAKCTQYNSITV